MHNFPIELLTLIDVRANKQTVYHPFLTKTQNRMQITGVCSKPKYDLRGWKKGANNFHASIIIYICNHSIFFFFLSPKIRNPLILSPRSMYLNRRYIGSFFSTFSTIPISTTPNFLHFASCHRTFRGCKKKKSWSIEKRNRKKIIKARRYQSSNYRFEGNPRSIVLR